MEENDDIEEMTTRRKHNEQLRAKLTKQRSPFFGNADPCPFTRVLMSTPAPCLLAIRSSAEI
jgi:hypothetical protein